VSAFLKSRFFWHESRRLQICPPPKIRHFAPPLIFTFRGTFTFQGKCGSGIDIRAALM